MTQTPGPVTDPAQHSTGEASGLDRFFDWLRSLDLRRDTEDKWLAGVCSGIANRLGVDPIVVRAGLVLLVLLGGLGITVYLIAWAFLPNLREEILAERGIRHGEVGGIVLLVIAFLSLLGGTGLAGDNNGFAFFWWIAVPIAAIVFLVSRRRRDGAAPRTSPYAGPAPVASTASTLTAPVPPFAPPGGPAHGAAAADGPTELPAAPYGPPPGGQVPAPPRSPRAPRPPRPPRRRGAGFIGAVLVSGMALAAYGLTLWLHDTNQWAGSDEVVALAVALTVFGAGVLGFGLAGRRSGLTGFLAVVLALITWTASVVPNLTFGGGVGDRVWRPSATDTTDRYRLGIGSAELDLSNVVDNPATAPTIEAGVGIGELRIRIPHNLTVEVRSSVGAGDIARTREPFGPPPLPDPDGRDLFDNSASDRDGTDISTTETFGEGAADVVVEAHVGLGQILIGQE